MPDMRKSDTNNKDDAMKDGERIAKFLARAGIASRREAEKLIEAGRIKVNGKVLTTPAFKVSAKDEVLFDGKPVRKDPPRLWKYHKPPGLLTTHNDPGGRPTVFENLPKELPRVISVGRLDMNSEGLLLLTNDGELARALELPSTGWIRRYRARAHGKITQEKLDGLMKGIEIDGIPTGPIEAVLDRQQRDNAWINVSIREGKNREVRRAMESLGLRVNRLIRVSYGPFQLGTVSRGQIEEVKNRILRDQVGHLVDIPKIEEKTRSSNKRGPKGGSRGGSKGGPKGKKTGPRGHGARPPRRSAQSKSIQTRAKASKPRGRR